jgi:hypothetical protein
MANGSDKLEKMLKALAADVGAIKKDLGDVRLTQARQFKQLTEGQGELVSSVRQLQSDQAHLAAAVSVAVSQLALAQSIIKRLERIEAAVFPAKH